MIDFGVGLVPIAGDLFHAVFKANSRNYALLYQYLLQKARDSPVLEEPPKQSSLRRWFGSGHGAEEHGKPPSSSPSGPLSSPAVPSAHVTQPPAAQARPADVEAQFHYSR
jgi:hypothetical protein